MRGGRNEHTNKTTSHDEPPPPHNNYDGESAPVEQPVGDGERIASRAVSQATQINKTRRRYPRKSEG
jgi:hypothetical protein